MCGLASRCRMTARPVCRSSGGVWAVIAKVGEYSRLADCRIGVPFGAGVPVFGSSGSRRMVSPAGIAVLGTTRKYWPPEMLGAVVWAVPSIAQVGDPVVKSSAFGNQVELAG